MVSEGFASAVHALADTVGPLPEDAAREFVARWSLEALFRELSAPAVEAPTIDAACVALAKVFGTACGAALLPDTLPYATAALQSPVAALRRPAAQQLARLVPAGAAAPADQQQAVELLVGALQDSDLGVASAAEAGLKQLAASGSPPSAPQHAAGSAAPAQLALVLDPGAPAGQALRRLASCEDPVLRMRSLTLLVALASQAPAAAAAVRQSGLLEPLLHELEDPDDLLSCMAALQLVRDAAEQCDAGMAAALQEAVMPHLGALLQHPEPVLASGALKAAASLLSASLEAGLGPMDLDQPSAGPAGTAAAANGVPAGAAAGAAGAVRSEQLLLAGLKQVLDVGSSQEYADELEEAALDAVGILGLHAAGATALLCSPAASVVSDVAYKALGRPPSPSQRMSALHALAAVAGAERLGRSGKLLAPGAEAALRVAVFEGAAAASAGCTPAEAVHQQLGQPFLEQRVAAYRCLAALTARDWMAGQVCSHADLLAFLLDAKSEASKQGSEWRHTCVLALAATIADVMAGGVGAGGPHQTALVAAAERVQAAARAGPFGAGAAGSAEQMVATMSGR